MNRTQRRQELRRLHRETVKQETDEARKSTPVLGGFVWNRKTRRSAAYNNGGQK